MTGEIVYTSENPSGRDTKLDRYFGAAVVAGLTPKEIHVFPGRTYQVEVAEQTKSEGAAQ